MSSTILLPFQPDAMTPAQLAAVSYLARYAGHTHHLYAAQLRRWFAWCENNRLDPLLGIQRAHIELYIRYLGETGLQASSINTMMHGVRGFLRFAHIDGLIPADPAVYARLPKIHQDESRTQGLDRLELIRFRIEDYRETLRGHRVLHLIGKGNKPATMPLTVPVLRVLEACRGNVRKDHSSCDLCRATRSTDATATGWSPASPRPPGSRGISTRRDGGLRGCSARSVA